MRKVISPIKTHLTDLGNGKFQTFSLKRNFLSQGFPNKGKISHFFPMMEFSKVSCDFNKKAKLWRGDAILREKKPVTMMEDIAARQRDTKRKACCKWLLHWSRTALIIQMMHSNFVARFLLTKSQEISWKTSEETKLEVKKGPLYRVFHFSVF